MVVGATVASCGAAAASGVPHLLQNRRDESFGCPQDGHPPGWTVWGAGDALAGCGVGAAVPSALGGGWAGPTGETVGCGCCGGCCDETAGP